MIFRFSFPLTLTFDLKLAPIIRLTLSSAMFTLNQKFLRLSCFEEIGSMGWMDRHIGCNA